MIIFSGQSLNENLLSLVFQGNDLKETTICISSRFYCRTITFVIHVCMATFSAKMLQHVQVIYFVNRWEAKFSKVRLKIFKCTWVKCSLETNLAPSVKPSNGCARAFWILNSYISLPSSAKQQREISKFYVYWRTRTAMASFLYRLLLKLNAVGAC